MACFLFFTEHGRSPPRWFCWGIGCGCGQPLSLTLVYNASPQGRKGEAAGMRTTVNQVAHFAVPLLFGGQGSIAGFAAVFF